MFPTLMIFLVAERLAELMLAERNRRWAVSRGGVETGKNQYIIVVMLHVFFLLSLVAEHHFLSRNWNPLWPLWLVIIILSQALRMWAILSLGYLWNTRIIVIPGARPVVAGPYKFIRHPNYVAVAIEILVIPVLCGAYLTAAVFSFLNAIALYWRIREEERALELLEGSDFRFLPRFIPGVGLKSDLRTAGNGKSDKGTRPVIQSPKH
jgi:methyltransferase